jgi:hypothetical protein
MSIRRRRLFWFAGIYVTSVVIFAVITYLLHAALRLL